MRFIVADFAWRLKQIVGGMAFPSQNDGLKASDFSSAKKRAWTVVDLVV